MAWERTRVAAPAQITFSVDSQSDTATAGDEAERSPMTSAPVPLRRALPAMLFCLTLTGAADAVASTGAVVGWGDDYYSQATPPDTVNGLGAATDIAAGRNQSCAIQAVTGEVVCWGDDYDGQATPPDAVNGVSGTATGIAAGYRHNLAIAGPRAPGAHRQRRLLGL
jgi:hypothetical protein